MLMEWAFIENSASKCLGGLMLIWASSLTNQVYSKSSDSGKCLKLGGK